MMKISLIQCFEFLNNNYEFLRIKSIYFSFGYDLMIENRKGLA